MAVVFISPKQRQKAFFIGITIILVLFLIIVSLVVLFSQPEEVLPEVVFNKPRLNIDMGIFDSKQFKSLQPFSKMSTLYSYKIRTASGAEKIDFITAASEEEALANLKSKNLTFYDLKVAELGRENPFEPTSASATAPKTK